MKRLDKKDLLLSPKVVSDLTGGSAETNYVVSDLCPKTFPDCKTSATPGGCNSNKVQCLSEEENACASNENCTGDECLLTGNDTCLCTEACPETQSDNDICCEASDDIDTKCCINPTFSVQVCQETQDTNCAETDLCAQTEGCMQPASRVVC